MSEFKCVFPKQNILPFDMQTDIYIKANEMLLSWAKATYKRKLKNELYNMFKNDEINEQELIKYQYIGKYNANKPTGTKSKIQITQLDIDFYTNLLFNKNICGNTPTISNSIGVTFNVNTGNISLKENKNSLTQWWVRISTLIKRERIELPLVANPYVTSIEQLSKGILARKDKLGRWRFEFVQETNKEKTIPDSDKFIGIDCGLNVIAATSNGELFGQDFKAKFYMLQKKINKIRANRQRQGLTENSKKLNVLEQRLSGAIKTAVGTVANKLIKKYPKHTFVLENMDLSGTRGQKRFCYKQLYNRLEEKSNVIYVNAAYNSQLCPSCNFFSRKNRRGTSFCCKNCGKKSHADVVGASNILKRFEDKNIKLKDNKMQVKEILLQRFNLKNPYSKIKIV